VDTDDPIRRRRKRTLAKLGWVCGQIERLLAGQDVTLADVKLPHEREPGETELERLERFKALLGETLGQLDRGEPRCCRACQQPLEDVALDEMPWAWTCGRCPGS